jgi:phosphoribosylaminoimidazole (AIR) synthetase
MASPEPFTYTAAGVDNDAGDEVVERIKPAVKHMNCVPVCDAEQAVSIA